MMNLAQDLAMNSDSHKSTESKERMINRTTPITEIRYKSIILSKTLVLQSLFPRQKSKFWISWGVR